MSEANHPRRLPGNWLLIVGLLALTLSSVLLLRGALARRSFGKPLALTAGSSEGQRHVLAELLAGELDGNRLKVVTTDGSLEGLHAIDSGEVQLAFVQGGLRTANYRNLRQVCGLHVEPLHLLVRHELYHNARKGLVALRGKRINISTPGSGSHALALGVLKFANLPVGPGGVQIEELGYSELLAIEDKAQLPDACFMVSSLPSPIARHLIETHGFKLVPIPFGNAFVLDGLRRTDLNVTSDAGPGQADAVDQLQIFQTAIPAYTYGVSPPEPSEPVQTLGTRLLLVAHKDLPNRDVYELLESLFASRFAQLMEPPIGESNLDLPAQVVLHEGVRDYLARNRPLVSQQSWEWFEQTVNIVAVFATGLFSVWIWLRQRRTRRRELSFGHYLQQVAAIENEALRREGRAALKLHFLLELQDQLRGLKREALENFGRGDLHGEELLTGFLTQVTDVRSYLTRLILHERENLEEQARQEDRPFAELWKEALAQEPPPSSGPS